MLRECNARPESATRGAEVVQMPCVVEDPLRRPSHGGDDGATLQPVHRFVAVVAAAVAAEVLCPAGALQGAWPSDDVHQVVVTRPMDCEPVGVHW
jgi:hypothetical protein